MISPVFEVMAPVLGLGLIGFIATRTGFFLATHREGLAKYVFDFAVPMLLFSAVVQFEPPKESAITLFSTYYLSLTIVFISGMALAWLLLNRSPVESMVIGLGACFSNTVLLGLPIIPRALGDEALYPLFLLISVHGISVFTVVTIAIEVARGRKSGIGKLPRMVLSGLLANPLVMSIGIGFLWKTTGIGLHLVAIDLLDLVSASVTPAALFVLGSSLASYRITGSVGPAVLVTILKNMVHPILVYILGSWLQLESLWLAVAVMLAAIPTGMSMYLFASRYDVSPPTAATSIFASTLSSIATLSVVIALLQD